MDQTEKLKALIKKKGLVFADQKKIISAAGENSLWLFDLRAAFLDPEGLALATDAFWQTFEKDYPFQVGGQELAAVPLVAAIVLHGQRIKKPVNGFIIRKSRKPAGLQNIIEGTVGAEKIILVDDLINSGSTASKQIRAVKNETGRNIDKFFTFINFRGEKNLELLAQKNIELISLFGLKDFGLTLNDDKDSPEKEHFKVLWHFRSPNPSFFLRVPKSAPCLADNKIYFGADNGYFYALDQADGSEAWKFKVGRSIQGKSILSSPAIHKNLVYFGSYDGNVYALDKESGEMRWKNTDADFVGSSPAPAPDLGMLFIGLEFGLFKKKGGLAALNLETGRENWRFTTENFVHCSPAYCPEKKLVAIGDNDGWAYLLDAKTGRLKWKFQTNGAIKSSLAFDLKRDLLLFGSFDKNLYALDIDTGEVKGKHETQEAIFSTPVVSDDNVYLSSLDKNLYSINLNTGALNWRFRAGGRLFAIPEIIDDKIFVGSTDGRLYEIDIQTGKTPAFFQTTERITNKIAYNSKTKRIFLPTYANEIYCLEKA